MVGKYTDFRCLPLGHQELQHAAMAVDRKLVIDWIEASHLESDWETKEHKSAWDLLKMPTAFWFPEASETEALKVKSLQHNYARTTQTPTSASALDLQVPPLNSAETFSMEGCKFN